MIEIWPGVCPGVKSSDMRVPSGAPQASINDDRLSLRADTRDSTPTGNLVVFVQKLRKLPPLFDGGIRERHEGRPDRHSIA